jgi:hypothetical protein
MEDKVAPRGVATLNRRPCLGVPQPLDLVADEDPATSELAGGQQAAAGVLEDG